jgi:uncharacterized protein YrzB (UPF0473 family)
MGTDPGDKDDAEATDRENGDGHIDEFDDSSEFDPQDLVTITDEDGNDIECAILMVIDHEGEDYALLGRVEQLTNEEGDEIEMFIFKYSIDDEGNQLFGFVEDDGTYESVRNAFALLMDQE